MKIKQVNTLARPSLDALTKNGKIFACDILSQIFANMKHNLT